MGPGEAVVGLGVCALAITFLAMTFAIYSRRLQFKQRKLELETEARTVGPGAELVAQLEKRVRVLERIATDRGHDVTHQIEALRDARASAPLPEPRHVEAE